MTLTDRSLTFLDKEISLRKEQKEYLSDVESPHKEFHGKSRELYLKLVSEIEVLEHLKLLAICDKQGREFSSRRMIVPKSFADKIFDGSELHAYLNDEAGQMSNSENEPQDNNKGDLVPLVWMIEKLRRREGGCTMNELISEANMNFIGIEHIKHRTNNY